MWCFDIGAVPLLQSSQLTALTVHHVVPILLEMLRKVAYSWLWLALAGSGVFWMGLGGSG